MQKPKLSAIICGRQRGTQKETTWYRNLVEFN